MRGGGQCTVRWLVQGGVAAGARRAQPCGGEAQASMRTQRVAALGRPACWRSAGGGEWRRHRHCLPRRGNLGIFKKNLATFSQKNDKNNASGVLRQISQFFSVLGQCHVFTVSLSYLHDFCVSCSKFCLIEMVIPIFSMLCNHFFHLYFYRILVFFY